MICSYVLLMHQCYKAVGKAVCDSSRVRRCFRATCVEGKVLSSDVR